MKQVKKSNIFTAIFKLIFSRFTLAIISVTLQLLLILAIFSFFENYVIYFIGGMSVVSILLVIWIINQNINNEFKISWIILILVLPNIGGLFYLFCKLEPTVHSLKHRLRSRKEENKKYLLQDQNVLDQLYSENPVIHQYVTYLSHVGHFPVYPAVDICYFEIGEVFYDDLLAKLKEAKKFIFLEFFIVANDKMWNNVLDILKEKASQGVEVRLLYDGTCSFFLLPRDYTETLANFSVKAKQFSPIIPLISTHYNNRDHRKIVVIDGVYSYTGGCNMASEYINQNSKYGHWKDNMIRFSGEAVNSFTTLFLEMWNLDETLDSENYTKYFIHQKIPVKDGYIIPFGDDPFDSEQIGKLTYMELLTTAKNCVDIAMPYFIIDGEFFNVLLHVAQKGVRIRLILPGIADKKIVNFIAKTYYKELIRYGIEIYEYSPGFTHLKIMISDRQTAVVGTINLDYRSLYLHFEDAVLLYKTSEIEAIQKDYEKTIQLCKRITKDELVKIPPYKLFLGKILRIFAPLL